MQGLDFFLLRGHTCPPTDRLRHMLSLRGNGRASEVRDPRGETSYTKPCAEIVTEVTAVAVKDVVDGRRPQVHEQVNEPVHLKACHCSAPHCQRLAIRVSRTCTG